MGYSGFAAGLAAGAAMGNQLVKSFQEGKLRRGLEKAAEVNPETIETTKLGAETTAGTDGMVYDSDTGQYLPKYMDGVQPTEQAKAQQGASPDGPSAAPESVLPSFNAQTTKQYRLGSTTRDEPFSDDQIQQHRLTKMSDVAAQHGDAGLATKYLNLADERRKIDDQREIKSTLAGDPRPGLEKMASPVTAGAGGDGQSVVPSGSYLQTVTPRVVDTYLKQGKVAEAKAWREFAESEDGRAYANDFVAAQRLVSAGNYDAAIPSLSRLYGRFPDGKRAETEHLGKGQYRITVIDEQSGKPEGSQVMSAADLSKQAVLALSPMKAVEFMTQQSSKRASEEALLNRQIQLEQLRQQGQETREDRRDGRLQIRLDNMDRSLDKRLSAQGGMTPSQARQNIEIEAAREMVSGLTSDDIRARTTPTTASGRENPKFDPRLASASKLASRRKLGDDPWFDGQRGQTSSFAGKPLAEMTDDELSRASSVAGAKGQDKIGTEVARRYLAAQPGMAGHQIGQYVEGKGYQVMNDQGQIVSYLRKKPQ